METTLDLPVLAQDQPVPLSESVKSTHTVYVETYGCQMNVNDSEIVLGVLHNQGFVPVDTADAADVILLNTCAIRDNAERKIHERLKALGHLRKGEGKRVVGVLGCMAERLRTTLLESGLVDVVVGPDEYRKVPELVHAALGGEQGIAVKLSRVETYDDIKPLRTEGIAAWLSIMRGCDKFCTFCVVPFTRGRERSRSLSSIVDEVKGLWDSGFREVTLLGQNVNSYADETSNNDFADLLAACAKASPQLRIRYTTSHPQDMSDKLIDTMAGFDNICKYIHLPVQSGSDRILQLMNRTYSVEHYMQRIERIRQAMPLCALSTDIIAGFCTETEEDHQATINAMRTVKYDGAYMFAYSPRENTKAWKMGDDVPDEVKQRRLQEIIAAQSEISRDINNAEIGRIHSVLVEGPSKRNSAEWKGRTDTNKTIIWQHIADNGGVGNYVVGDVVTVKVNRSTSATLFGELQS